MAEMEKHGTRLKLVGVTKVFPGVRALDNVDFELRRGEIHALMGENGAGKSTLIKVISGVYIPDGGEMYLDGERVFIHSPRDAYRHSIAVIHQRSTSYQNLSVAENIFIGHEKTARFGTIDWAAERKAASGLLRSLGSDIDPEAVVGSLTVAEQQIVEIAKAISTNADILIMDEPTASLSLRETDNLYRIANELVGKGVSIIFISHRFEDTFKLADRVTILRDGRNGPMTVGGVTKNTWAVSEITADDMIRAMVGREIKDVFPVEKRTIGEVVFEAEGLSRAGYFSDVSFSVRKGEIVGFTGLVGAGRTEIVQAIFGADRLGSGEIRLEGERVAVRSPADALRLGIGLLPEDRLEMGLILDWEIFRNVTLASLHKFVRRMVVDTAGERRAAAELGARIAVKAPDVYESVSKLSGGNQQKVVVCKLLCADLRVIVLDEPTKGVDVGAKRQIYDIMNRLSEDGYAIIFISSDMPEIIGMSDRILAVHNGRVTGEFRRADFGNDEDLQHALLSASMGLAQEGGRARAD